MSSPHRAAKPATHHRQFKMMPTPRPSTNVSGMKPVILEVHQEDITKMNYYFNEAPMFDARTKSAIAFALQRLVKKDLKVFVDLREAKAIALIGDQSHSLGSMLGGWLADVHAGKTVEPTRQAVWLAVDLLRHVESKLIDVSDADG